MLVVYKVDYTVCKIGRDRVQDGCALSVSLSKAEKFKEEYEDSYSNISKFDYYPNGSRGCVPYIIEVSQELYDLVELKGTVWMDATI